jgi:hypothetical protein
MTDGFDSAVILSIFAEPDTWQNGLTNNPSEKYISEFPAVVKQGKINDKTIKDGIQAIKKALQWMIKDKMAESIEATGEALTVHGLAWTISVLRGNLENIYSINWSKGIITLQKDQV